MRKGWLHFLKNQTTSKKFADYNTEITYVELALSLCNSQASTKGSLKFGEKS